MIADATVATMRPQDKHLYADAAEIPALAKSVDLNLRKNIGTACDTDGTGIEKSSKMKNPAPGHCFVKFVDKKVPLIHHLLGRDNTFC